MSFFRLVLTASLMLQFACNQQPSTTAWVETKQNLPPDERYGELFVAVQMNQIFPDGKTFVDCIPKYPTDEILSNYRAAKDQPGFDLKAFVLEQFELPRQFASGFQSDPSRTAIEHINALWPVLTRQPDADDAGTLLPLPHPYVVPGGRFGEIYYWDSYFTMLGLQTAGRTEMIQNMVDNFAFMIDTVGFIPNGNRTYFLSRSQPPFFAAMVDLLAGELGEEVLVQYRPQLRKEYDFWMAGASDLSEANPRHLKVVRLPDGRILNRYYDMREVPRAEMYRDDVETAARSGRLPADVYRDLRSACESGWDFSSRWLTDPKDLATIHTTDIIPVDLNALLFNLEKILARAYRAEGNATEAGIFDQRAGQRREAVMAYCWDETGGFFMDYDFVAGRHTGVISPAGMFPFFFRMVDDDAFARKAAEVLEKELLKEGGLASTNNITGQQWDAPNGWAPLQWIAIQGLRHYGQEELAARIKRRWTDLNLRVYENTGKMVEKYNVMDMGLEAGGGEYPVQDGFGWTNGVLLKLLSEKELAD